MKRGSVIWDNLLPWIIGFGVFVLVIILYIVLTEKGQAAIDYLETLFRFGR
ncbi:MAG: hypothetical protein KJ718_06495 [Nanoarchaeota archaeon]|nr:hypothetical protein [Nanoarchaeota archaeon]MBU1052167.1 hypothetical protein [Nanoarchaeota archaeon]MBU1987983.1 hypothetical protein [Nanoarchaeota archaeon]